MINIARVLSCIALVFGCQGIALGERPGHVEAIEMSVLKHRQNLISGHVEFHSVVHINAGRLAGQTLKKNFQVYFSGDRIRGDYSEQYFPLGTSKGRQSHPCRLSHSYADGVFRLYCDQKYPVPRPAEIRPLTDPSAAGHFRVPDPRKVGMLPEESQVYEYHSLNFFCGNANWTFVDNLGIEQLRGLRCNKWRYRWQGIEAAEGQGLYNVFLTVWISPECDNSIAGLLYESPTYSTQIECDLHDVESYGWYPSLVETTCWRNGELQQEEQLKVIVHGFNQPLEDDFFRLTGMGAPAGLEVHDRISNRILRMTENGPEEVEEQELYGHATSPLAGAKRSGVRSLLLTVNAIAVGLLAFIVLWRTVLKRH